MTILYCLKCDDEVREFDLGAHMDHSCIVRRDAFRPLNRRDRRWTDRFLSGALGFAVSVGAVGLAIWMIWRQFHGWHQ